MVAIAVITSTKCGIASAAVPTTHTGGVNFCFAALPQSFPIWRQHVKWLETHSVHFASHLCVRLDILCSTNSPLHCCSCSFNYQALVLTFAQAKCWTSRTFFCCCSLSHLWNRRLCDIYPQYCSSHHQPTGLPLSACGDWKLFPQLVWTKDTSGADKQPPAG